MFIYQSYLDSELISTRNFLNISNNVIIKNNTPKPLSF